MDDLVTRNLPVLQRSMTFARMIDLKSLPNLKDSAGCFPRSAIGRIRRTLTDCERSRYLCAFQMIEMDGTLGQLVDIHAEMHMQHTNARLLPWHRVFLLLFEEALHNYHPDVCVPDWDWTRPEEQHFPDWLASVLPTVHTPTRTIVVTRSPWTGQHARVDRRGRADGAGQDELHGLLVADQRHPRLGAHLVRRDDVGRVRLHRPIRCSGCTTRISIASGGSGTTAPPAITRIRR